jgi:lipopolysaccharide transport system ATP-binding protein
MTPVVHVDSISKMYRIGANVSSGEYRTLRESIVKTLLPWTSNGRKKAGQIDTLKDFWALKDISFDVEPGEVVGIVGRNGAGKSTLLKILSRVTKPTAGRILLKGRISSLLEVGTGFHPELTGRENIFLNGSILGMSRREIWRKFDEIVDFSEVEDFLDTPVKRYSSGMYVRLAFAVAAHLEPEVLVVDEVLAVGDADFQKKCLRKMQNVASNGRAVLVVSHSMGLVEALCSRVIALSAGSIVHNGPTREVIASYTGRGHIPHGQLLQRPTSSAHLIQRVEILDPNGAPISMIRSGDDVVIRVHIRALAPLPKARIGIRIDGPMGVKLLHLQSEMATGSLLDLPADSYVDCRVPKIPLIPGHYSTSIALFSERRLLDQLDPAFEFSVDLGDFFGHGHIPANYIAPFLSPSIWTIGHSALVATPTLD